MESSFGEDEIIAYLVGDLNAGERDALDARLSVEPLLAETVMAVEDDLLAEYARGGLSAQTRARVEKAYNEIPARRERLESAFAFLDSIPRPRPPARRAGYFVVSMLAAATLVLAVWLPSRRHFDSARIESDASFVLEAGRTRSGAGREIVLPAGARTIEFQLRLQDQPGIRYWRVSLGTVEHPASWSGLASSRDRLVVTDVPASVLAPGDYTLKLFGGDTGADTPERATYYFRIE